MENSAEHEVNQAYIRGDIDRYEYHYKLAAIHDGYSKAAKLGPCQCPACTEHRNSKGDTENV